MNEVNILWLLFILQKLQDTTKKIGSDLHLTVGAPPTFRINGKLITTKDDGLIKDIVERLEEISVEGVGVSIVESHERQIIEGLPIAEDMRKEIIDAPPEKDKYEIIYNLFTTRSGLKEILISINEEEKRKVVKIVEQEIGVKLGREKYINERTRKELIEGIIKGLPQKKECYRRIIKDLRTTLTKPELHTMIYSILTDEQRSRFEKQKEIDFPLEITGVGRFRVNVFSTRQGKGAAFRSIPSQIPKLDELGILGNIKQFTELEKGLVIVAGSTGSGKSTTIAAMIDEINQSKQCHILTIEDPIEFIHEHKSSRVNQKEVYSHTKSFKDALKNALREDPDVILVGEMRDLEAIQLTLTAAETGHLVFSTLHTGDPAQAINRMIDVFPPAQQQQIRVQIAECLEGIISQVLVPKKNGLGRVCAAGVVVVNDGIRSVIRDGRTHQLDIYTQFQEAGGISLENHLLQLSQEGEITNEDVKRYARRIEMADHVAR